MRVLITGAFGFIGSHLVQALLSRGTLVGPSGVEQRIEELWLLDVAAGGEAFAADPRVRRIVADASDPHVLGEVVDAGVHSVFALGATLTSQAETDFARGLEVNLHGMLRLLEACRLRARQPRFVFTSSIAAFGGRLPEMVGDEQRHTPQTSYGTAKAISELLINDYSRHRFVDGRALRLPIVLVRPSSGAANPAISDRLAALIREPLQGRDVNCPWRPDTLVPVASARAAVAALLRVHDLQPHQFADTRAMNLDSMSVRIDALVNAVQGIASRRRWLEPLGRVSFVPDPAVQAIVDQWPQRFESERARALGVRGDESIDAIVDHFILDYLQGAAGAGPRSS
jgi:nucleoside-diphosphate-sugar epimerase